MDGDAVTGGTFVGDGFEELEPELGAGRVTPSIRSFESEERPGDPIPPLDPLLTPVPFEGSFVAVARGVVVVVDGVEGDELQDLGRCFVVYVVAGK